MKNNIAIFLLLLIVSSFNSCKKEKDEPIVSAITLTPEKFAVKTFEIVYIKVGTEVADSYNATLGSSPLTIKKSNDSTLFFIVPDIAESSAQLNFDLGSIQFKVTKTPEVIPNDVFTAIIQSLDADIAEMSSDTAMDLAAIDTMLAFKATLTAKYQALTDSEKRLNCMVYEANKNDFEAFRNSFDNSFDIAPEFRIGSISGCPDSPKKEKFTCFAKEIAFNAYVLSEELHTAVNIIETDNVFGQFIPAAYLLIVQQRSRIIDFRNYLNALLNKKWIIDERMYNGVPTTYNNEEYTPLNLNPTVRTINPSEDVFLNLSDIRFFDNIASLKFNWDRLPFLGAFPPYVNAEEPTSLSEVIGSEDISVTNVSANAQHIGPIQYLNGNADVKFKTISGLTESFSFTLKFEKDGFLVTKRIENATLIGNSCGNLTTITDNEGNIYPVVSIGNQCWTATNLRTSKFSDGSLIPYIADSAAWAQVSAPALCFRDNNSLNSDLYGNLYNLYAATDSRNLCPTGWHVPSDPELTVLIDYLGGESIAGGKMKSVTGWNTPNVGATNESGFSGLPGGSRVWVGNFPPSANNIGYWWTSSPLGSAWYLWNIDGNIVRANDEGGGKSGLSVRCVKD